MANIHLNRDRRSLGQFPPDEVAEGLQSGRFFPTDLGWAEGMASWLPLSEFKDLPIVAPPIPDIAPGVDLLAAAPSEIQPAWERRPAVPFFLALFQTIRDTVAQPGLVFSALNPQGGLGRPLAFYVIVGFLTSLVAMFYQVAIVWVDPSSLGKEFEGQPTAVVMSVMAGAMAVVTVMLPFFLTLSAFVSGGLVHLSLMLLGAANKPFRTTFQVAAYANGAAFVFQVVPMCGAVIAWVYGVVLTIIGIQKAQEIEMSKAVIAVLLPVVLFCGVMVALVAVLSALGGAAFLEAFAK